MPQRGSTITCVRVKNGHAALGCQIAYATPVRLSLDGQWIRTFGGVLKLSRLKSIEQHSAYEMTTYYSLTLDDGAVVDNGDCVRVGD